MFFLTPRHVKLGRQFVKDAKKLLAYKRDLWSEATIADVESHIAQLDQATKSRDEQQVKTAAEKLDDLLGKHIPPHKDAAWRENVEVFLVAIVVALGVRTYFLQPFTIPTSSMYPTLNGIIFHESKDPMPNPLLRALYVPVYGRHYVNFVAEERETVLKTQAAPKSPLPFINRIPGLNGGFFDRSEIVTQTESGRMRTYTVKEAVETLDSQFPRMKWQGRVYEKGEAILSGYFDAGDHVFVDKISYHFRKPQRSETFVFSTAEIPQIKARSTTSQYYIKRLAGTPNDTLQIRPPELYLNGERAKEPGFNRVMSGELQKANDGYRGYGNGVAREGYDQAVFVERMTYLSTPDQTFKLGPNEYFALGDNSYNSWDSRGWGPVPEKSIMGRALLVYWPFLPHFGLTK